MELSSKLKIFVEKDVFEEESYEDIIGKYFEVIPLSKEDIIFYKFDKGLSSLFRGSINLGLKLGYNYKWTDCSYWLPPLREFCLNKKSIFLDANEIVKKWFKIIEFLAPSHLKSIRDYRKLFIRCSSGTKIFTGGVFSLERFERELLFMKEGHNIDPYFLCLVSDPKIIDYEYRCVFIDGKFVDACQYMREDELEVERITEEKLKEVKKKAEEIVANDIFQENIDFVLDIAQCGNSLYLLEINSFCSSSFYACDLDKIYKTWSESLIF